MRKSLNEEGEQNHSFMKNKWKSFETEIKNRQQKLQSRIPEHPVVELALDGTHLTTSQKKVRFNEQQNQSFFDFPSTFNIFPAKK